MQWLSTLTLSGKALWLAVISLIDALVTAEQLCGTRRLLNASSADCVLVVEVLCSWKF